MITSLPCIILAGGRSSRMGQDKSLLPFGEFNTLIEFQHNKLSKIFQNVYISAKIDKFNFNNKFKLIIDNNKKVSSPMIALQSIFIHLKCKLVFIIAVDTPFICYETIQTIVDNSNKHDITIPLSQGSTHNLCGIFSSSILPQVEHYLTNNIHTIDYLIKNSNTNIIKFHTHNEFLNINTRKDYQKGQYLYNF